MPEYIIDVCTVADGPDVGRNNMTAFWQDLNWRLSWNKVGLPYLIEQSGARYPCKFLGERDTARHFKAVDPETGKLLGYARWSLPQKYCRNEDGSPVWPEGQVPEVDPEEEARIVHRAEAADWNPDKGSDALDVVLTKTKNELLAKKDYIVLDFFAVHPENQRKGVGTALLKYGIQKAVDLGIDIFVMACAAGFRVYDNAGFDLLESIVQDATAYGGTDYYAFQFMEYRVSKE